jgi:hypothetical protein
LTPVILEANIDLKFAMAGTHVDWLVDEQMKYAGKSVI